MTLIIALGVLAVIALIVGIIIGRVIGKNSAAAELKAEQDRAQVSADSIIKSAEKQSAQIAKDAKHVLRDAELEAKELAQKYRNEVEKDLKDRRDEVKTNEARILQKEQTLDNKDQAISKREISLDSKLDDLAKKQENLAQREDQVEKLIEQQNEELHRISSLSKDEARALILKQTEDELASEVSIMIKNAEDEARDTADRKAKELLTLAIQRSAADTVSETTISVVSLPNDEMKGRIIGREGRNIRTLETLTGIDLIIDDTPEAVVLSGFDPIRREIARMSLESLLTDGRIHPARIEETVEKARKEIDQRIRDYGEQAAFELGIPTLNPELIKLLGRLHFRTSYGQNALNHSIEVAKLTGILAAEIGEDVQLAKRAGLLHDIGKAIDHEIEGSHVEIGAEIAAKYKENEIVVNSITSHHGDVEATNAISVLVAAADALSAARPGARSETLGNYTKRLEALESITNSFEGVDSSFAIQAGREVRVIVNPEKVTDLEAIKLSHDIKKKIEDGLDYPGHIKVTVTRETRAIDYAK
ncbi:MAG: ribonuclease Y [Lactobacillales bacterium]|jgi:ribonuclease Y|nr:ribonuclease Y [Lactobacillales bacterium]